MNKKSQAALLSVGSNSVLIAMKVAVGITTGSVSIISEAIHSSMDLMAALIAFFSVRKSDSPPDKDHPYGHGKIEKV
jgi:cation diffusion facilitator family transporter